MIVKVGNHYLVSMHPRYLSVEVQATSAELKKKYPLYGKLQGKEVVILASTIKNTAYKIALVEENDNYWFTLDKKYLKPISKSCVCRCDTKLLLNRGCKCGAFAREQGKEESNTKKQLVVSPW